MEISVLGLANVGALASEHLHESGFTVIGMYATPRETAMPFDTNQIDVSDVTALRSALVDYDAVLSCLPYSFNWSPEGVVNLYLNDCEVLEEGSIKWVSPMEWIEKIVIGGIELEAFTTSGGLGTMCETYNDRVPSMGYKTMRYPGHVKLMNFFCHELLLRDRRKEAGEILVNAKLPVNDDIVYIHVSAEGWVGGRLERREFVRGLKPIEIGGIQRTAIAWTTASSVAAVTEMVRDGKLPNKGFFKQEDIPLESFLQTRNGVRYGA